MKTLYLLLTSLLFSSAVPAGETEPAAPLQYGYQVVTTRPHDTSLFTQGLLIDDGHFYESSGLYGRSFLARYPVTPGITESQQHKPSWSRHTDLPKHYFAEGLALLDKQLYLLTWQEQKMLVYNRETFALEQEFSYEGEGWGLTYQGDYFIRSDGTHRLHFHHPDDFSLVKSIEVKRQGVAVNQLNELEFIDGKVWANIWHEPRIVIINPDSGVVEAELDLSAIAAQHTPAGSEKVLNGIAWHPQQQTLWITGKMWPLLYQLKIIRR